jgi:hypothetical protein
LIKRWYREEFERAAKVLEVEVSRRKQAESKLGEASKASMPPKPAH